MAKIKKLNHNPAYRLMVRLIIPNQPKVYAPDGRQIIMTEWKEVLEFNFGSKNKPNKECVEFKLIPIIYEQEEKHDRHNRFNSFR